MADSELVRLLRQIMNKSAFVNGAPTSESFANTTDSLENLYDSTLIPGADAATDVQERDVVGGKADTANYDVGAASSLVRYLKALVNQTKELKRLPLYPVLSEFWASDTVGIDGNMWATAVAGAGTVTRATSTSSPMRVTVSTGDAAGGSTARLRTVVLFRASPTNYTTSFTPKRFVIQWEGRFTTVSAFDNATFFMGLTDATGSDRSSNNIIGYGLSADALQTVTDNGGVEGTNLPGGITLTNWNEYRVEITRIAGVNTVEFFVNDALVATHNTAANIPDTNSYLNVFVDGDTTGTAILDVGAVTGTYHDVDVGSWEV